MRTGQEREMREKIIDTAIEEFTRNGLKFTMNDVAKALGISKKTIYTVFESKQDVLMAIADRYARDFTDMRQEIEADTELDTLEKLERLFCAIPTKYYNIGLSRIFELAQKYPKQYKYLMEAVSQGWALAEQYLEKGIREGKIRPELVIGVPVGFVNVVQSKEMILTLEHTPYIIAKGRKGGSNIAACICNALLYML